MPRWPGRSSMEGDGPWIRRSSAASTLAKGVHHAQDMGLEVAYLPGLAMRRLADLHAGNAKTDARDAHVIAEAARTLPCAAWPSPAQP